MIFSETPLAGAYSIELQPRVDKRGSFMRTFCRESFAIQGLPFTVVQSSISYNRHKGVLRGMHYQAPPHEEEKLVMCLKGAIYDVIIDLRKDSATFKKWFALELSERRPGALYIPKGFAHGFQSLEDNTVVLYYMSEAYDPMCSRTVPWNDPELGIEWPPCVDRIISDHDKRVME